MKNSRVAFESFLRRQESVIFFVILLLPIIASCMGGTKDPGEGEFDKRFEIFYNEPVYGPRIYQEKTVNKIVDLINGARQSIDAAFYGFNHQGVIAAFEQARSRGIKIRFAGDVDEKESPGYRAFLGNGIRVALGNKAGIMHHKFMIVDGRFLFSGTGNITDNGLLRNNNNFFIIESAQMVKNFQSEFEELFHGRFGRIKNKPTPNRTFTVNGIPIENYFSPQEGGAAMARIIQLIQNARHSIHFMIYAFTHDDLARALIEATRRGVVVKGIIDKTSIKGISSEATRLYSASKEPFGPFIYMDGNENVLKKGDFESGGKLHVKTMLIDNGAGDAKAITGSFNWSFNSVENNDENLVIFHSRKVTNILFEQWRLAKLISKDPAVLGVKITGDALGGKFNSREAHLCGDQILREQDVIINEIHWAGSGNGGSFSGDDQMVELRNLTLCPIELNHWSLQWLDENGLPKFWPIPDQWNSRLRASDFIIPAIGFLVIKAKSNEAFESVICRGEMANDPFCQEEFKKIAEDCHLDPTGKNCMISLEKYCNLTKDKIDIKRCEMTLTNIKIARAKDFNISRNFFRIVLRDKRMNIIDIAGNGQGAFAGTQDPQTNGLNFSMERRDFDVDGQIPLYDAEGHIINLFEIDSRDGTLSENWCTSDGDGTSLSGGKYVDPDYKNQVIATPLEANSCR